MSTMAATHVHTHGSSTCYVHCKCRCHVCRTENARRETRRARKKRAGIWVHPYVPAAPVREHVEQLRAGGMGYKTIAAAAGVHPTAVRSLIYGREDYLPGGGHGPRHGEVKKQVSRETATRILQLKPTLKVLAGRALVPAVSTQMRLRALVAAGWSQQALATRMGMNPSNFRRTLFTAPQVRAETARAVVAVFTELAYTTPPTGTRHEKRSVSRSRRAARDHGWKTPDELLHAWRTLQNRTPSAAVARDPQTLRPGSPVELVRWVATPDGMRPETITGVLVGSTKRAWRLRVDEDLVELPRPEWSECTA